MSLSKEDDGYEKEVRSKFRKFMHKIATRLVDVVEKREQLHNSSHELNMIAQASITVMFIYRSRYRQFYKSVREKIIHRRQYTEFCKIFFDHENLPYFFTFLLNIAVKFEMFLYLREEGYNYFAVFAHTLANYTNYSIFQSEGGVKELSEIAQFFIELTEDLQILVNTEYPCRKKLLSLQAHISEIENKYFELSEENSFIVLKQISRSLYYGLENDISSKALPFIILRFILDGRFPTVKDKITPENSNDSKDIIERYFNRCLIPEILCEIGLNNKFSTQSVKKVASGVSEKESSDSACKTNKTKSQKKKAQEYQSDFSDSEDSSIELNLFSEDRSYGSGLEWLKHFDAKTVSLLNIGTLNESKKLIVSVSKNCKMLKNQDESSNYVYIPLDKAIEVASSVIQSSEEENIKCSEVKANQSKKSRRRRRKKLKRVEKTDSEDSLNFAEQIDPIKKLKENFVSILNNKKIFHIWEKKFMFYFLKKANTFSAQEKHELWKIIQEIPIIDPEEEEDLMKMIDLMDLEEKSHVLYSDNEDDTFEKLPFPSSEENITEEFAELMISILAVSCDGIVQASVLGNWMQFLHNILMKNASLKSLLFRCGLNGFPLLKSHAAK